MDPSPTPVAALPVLRVDRVAKTYTLWTSPGARLGAPLTLRFAGLLRRLWPALAMRMEAAAWRQMPRHEVLRDVSFELHRGQALGIIGANGSGKSTLLQIVAGVLSPSAGRVETHGRIAALLELGSGFNPELTGRENIHINAAILGLTPAQIAARLDEIIAFADLGEYIDQPVKTYSSGMAARLAFAVQVHIDPDILIVDEALSVGDAAFQAKAMARVDQILQGGTTLLFVGHDLNVVKAFCHEAILLEGGGIALHGLPDEVITEYLHRTHLRALRERGTAATLARVAGGFGLADAQVVQGRINGASHVALRCGEPLEIALEVALNPGIAHPLLIVDVMDGRGLQLTGRRITLPRVASARSVPVQVALAASFQQGVYRLRTRLLDSADLQQHHVLARQEGLLSFEVVDDSRERFTGLFPVPMAIRVDQQEWPGSAS